MSREYLSYLALDDLIFNPNLVVFAFLIALRIYSPCSILVEVSHCNCVGSSDE